MRQGSRWCTDCSETSSKQHCTAVQQQQCSASAGAFATTHGWLMLIPSLSTMFTPSLSMLNSMLAIPSSNRLISST